MSKDTLQLQKFVKDYNDDNTTAINKPLDSAEQTLVSVNSASNFTVDDYIRLGEEEYAIRSISGNELTVYRGVDGTVELRSCKWICHRYT